MKAFSVLFMMIVGLSTAWAQPPSEGMPLERIERFKKMRMIEMLDLSEDQSIRFFARHHEFEMQRRNLMQRRIETLDKIERLIRNKAEGKEYETLFAEAEDLNGKLADEKRRFFDGLSDILVIEQRAKLLLFERRFESELRDAVREVHKRRKGRFGDEGK